MREDWTQLHAAADRRGYGAGNHGPTGTPSVRWRLERDRVSESAPVVGQDRAYAADEDGTLYAVERTSGSVAWTFDVDGNPYASPALYGGLAFVATSDGRLSGVTAADGECVWTRTVGSTPRVSPAVADGTLYVSGRDAPVYALDPSDGTTRWAQSAVEMDGSPAASDGLVVVSGAKALVVCDAATGEIRWRRDVGGTDAGTTAALANGRAYVACEDDRVRAFDLDTGETAWRVDCSHWDYYATVGPAPAVDDDRVYVGYFPREVAAFDAADGERLWEASLPPEGTVAQAALSVTDDGLYAVANSAGGTYRLDPASGDVQWRVEVHGETVGAPAVADGTLFARCYRGGLCALADG
jgi:outer membrane protein assembly factor BamB